MKNQESTQSSELTEKKEKLPRYSILMTLLTTAENFITTKWQQLPRIRNLSGLSETEISDLPSNDLVTQLFTALMRAWQKDVRSHFIGKIPSSKLNNTREKRLQKPKKDKDSPFVIWLPGESEPHPFTITLNDYINPFEPNGERVYGTEYAQLVNIAARKAKQEGVISSKDVLALTLLASIQLPPGVTPRGMRLMPDFFLQGGRIKDEAKRMQQDINFLVLVPLTEERIRDSEFVNNISIKKILTTSSFKLSFKEAKAGLIFGK